MHYDNAVPKPGVCKRHHLLHPFFMMAINGPTNTRKVSTMRISDRVAPIGAIIVFLATAPLASAAVGRIPAVFNVSGAGAATYSIPISVPPGVRGLAPRLALVYNSQAGNGVYGPGWSLSGLSVITRCNGTWAQDGGATPVALTYADRFCLDGRRLRITSSGGLPTYGQPGTTYQTEVADFSNITANGTQGNGPASFTVQGKDGLTYQYGSVDANGNGAGSLVLASGTTTADQWWLSKITDRDGNSIAFNYTTMGLAGATEPAQILWTAASAGSATYMYSVGINYGQSSPQPVKNGYVSGTYVNISGLVNTITVKNGTSTIQMYSLAYETAPNTGGYRLRTVTRCDSTLTNCLSPTVIGYQNGQVGVVSSGSTAIASPGGVATAQYDFNGDGLADVLFYAGAWKVAFSTGSGYGAPINTGITDGGAAFGDVQGTGTAGILARVGTTLTYYKWNGTAFSGTSSTSTAVGSLSLTDITGDGLPDIVSINGNTVLTYKNQSTPTTVSFGTATTAYTFSQSNLTSATLYASAGIPRGYIDFNGDGKNDVALALEYDIPVGQNGDKIVDTNYELLSNGAGAAFTAVQLPKGGRAWFVNWNDDQCTDAAVGGMVYISGCNGSIPSSFSVGTILTAMDWNADGRTDIVVANGSTLGVYLSTGSGVSALQSTTIPYYATGSYFTFDIDGDGLDDLGYDGPTSPYPVTYWKHNQPGTPPNLATSFADGFGVTYSPTYVSIAQGNYTKNSDGSYPDVDWVGPQYVVSQFSASDGASATYTKQYWYYGARVNLQGRGGDGFYAVRSFDSRNGLSTAIPTISARSRLQAWCSRTSCISRTTRPGFMTSSTRQIRLFSTARQTIGAPFHTHTS